MPSGSHLSLEQARGLLGNSFAAQTNLGWLTGKVVAIVDRPQIIVEDQNGVIHHVVIDIVHDWAASDEAPSFACDQPWLPHYEGGVR